MAPIKINKVDPSKLNLDDIPTDLIKRLNLSLTKECVTCGDIFDDTHSKSCSGEKQECRGTSQKKRNSADYTRSLRDRRLSTEDLKRFKKGKYVQLFNKKQFISSTIYTINKKSQ